MRIWIVETQRGRAWAPAVASPERTRAAARATMERRLWTLREIGAVRPRLRVVAYRRERTL